MAGDYPIPLVTEAPNPSDPEEVFDLKTFNFLNSLNPAIMAANAAFQSIGTNFNATSASSVEIGGGIKNFIVEPNLFLTRGMTQKAVYSLDIRKSMRGEIESYNKTTGELSLDVTKAIGNGTYDDWTFSIAVDGGSENDFGYAETTGTASLYEVTLDEPIAEYKDGQLFPLKLHTTCNTNAKIRFSALNPPLDLKLQDKYGAYVNVFQGDLIGGNYTTGMVILGGTALLVEASIDAEERVGALIDYFGIEPLFNTFEIPQAPTNISRAAYPKLLKKLIKSNPVTIGISAGAPVNWAAHGLANGCPIYLTTTGALPTGLSVNTKYYVVNSVAGSFNLSATKGGAAITTSGTQSGVHTANYAPWGNGDGVNTFGCPYIKLDHTEVRGGSGNFGEETVGQVLAHDHTVIGTFGGGGSNQVMTPESSAANPRTTSSTGGPANLAAGIRLMKLIVYQ